MTDITGTDEEFPEEQTYFVDCTCTHDPGQHGWAPGCEVEGCSCEGGWEE